VQGGLFVRLEGFGCRVCQGTEFGVEYLFPAPAFRALPRVDCLQPALRSGVWGVGFGVWGLGLGAWGLGFGG
jgi:hypothetical protein